MFSLTIRNIDTYHEFVENVSDEECRGPQIGEEQTLPAVGT